MDWKLGLLASSVVVCTGSANAAQAQDAAKEPAQEAAAGEEQGSTIVVYGHGGADTNAALGLELTPRETPQSITAVTEEQIEDQALTTVADVLTFATGISAKAVDRGRNTLSARGFEIVNFQIDGAPFATGNIGFDETSTAIYDRVEIVRGSTGLLNGVGEPSASVNLLRKHAVSDTLMGEVTLEGGSWDRFAVTGDVTVPLTADGSVRSRFVAQAYRQDSFVDLEESNGYIVYGIVDADLGPDTRLSVGASHQRDERSGVLWGQLPYWFSDGTRTDWARSKTTAARWNQWDTTQQLAFIMLEHGLGGGWSLRGDVGYQRQVEDSKLLWTWGEPDPDTGVGMSAFPYWYLAKPRQWNVNVMAKGPFTLFGRQHELVAGAMYNHLANGWTNRDPVSPVADVGDFFAWDGSYPEPEWGPRYDLSSQGTTEQYAAYAVTRLALLDNLKLIAGGRLSTWKRNEDAALYTPQAYTIEHEGKFTPYAGLVLDLTDNLSAYVSYASIFNPQTNQDRNGDYLDPLEGNSYEVGLKGEFLDGRLAASAAYFRIEQDNFPVADVGFFVPGTSNPAFLAAQGTVAKGYEVELSGEITPDWNVNLGWTDFSANDADGLPVQAHHPRRLLKLATVYDLRGSLEGLSIGGSMRWESRPPQTATNPGTGAQERVGQPAYAIVNLMAKYALNARASLQLNVNNVFDQAYFSNNAWFAGFVYGEPRNARVTLRYAF